jgi:hypothetical protein
LWLEWSFGALTKVAACSCTRLLARRCFRFRAPAHPGKYAKGQTRQYATEEKLAECRNDSSAADQAKSHRAIEKIQAAFDSFIGAGWVGHGLSLRGLNSPD